MAKTVDKGALLAALKQHVQDALEVMTRAAHTAREAATHEEMKPENDKDTRGLEAGYLAGAQAARAAELKRTLAELSSLEPRAFEDDERIAACALVVLRDLDSETHSRVFLAPAGGGLKVTVQGVEVQVVTTRSPLGDALLGKRRGDAVEVEAGGRRRELEVVGVR